MSCDMPLKKPIAQVDCSLANVASLAKRPPTDNEFDRLLRRHGLADVALAVKRKRRGQARNIRWAILKSQDRAPRWCAMVKRSGRAIGRSVLGK
jgi:hypothetical protein